MTTRRLLLTAGLLLFISWLLSLLVVIKVIEANYPLLFLIYSMSLAGILIFLYVYYPIVYRRSVE